MILHRDAQLKESLILRDPQVSDFDYISASFWLAVLKVYCLIRLDHVHCLGVDSSSKIASNVRFHSLSLFESSMFHTVHRIKLIGPSMHCACSYSCQNSIGSTEIPQNERAPNVEISHNTCQNIELQIKSTHFERKSTTSDEILGEAPTDVSKFL